MMNLTKEQSRNLELNRMTDEELVELKINGETRANEIKRWLGEDLSCAEIMVCKKNLNYYEKDQELVLEEIGRRSEV